MEPTVILWVLGGFAAFLMFLLGIVFRQSAQIAVLQKTVDSLVVRLDQFLSNEIDVLKEIAKR